MDVAVARCVNLLEHLQELHPGIPEPPADAFSWTEEQIRQYYDRRGQTVAFATSQEQAGGGVPQTADPEAHKRTPAAARANQLIATVAGYREAVLRDGIPFRSVT